MGKRWLTGPLIREFEVLGEEVFILAKDQNDSLPLRHKSTLFLTGLLRGFLEIGNCSEMRILCFDEKTFILPCPFEKLMYYKFWNNWP